MGACHKEKYTYTKEKCIISPKKLFLYKYRNNFFICTMLFWYLTDGKRCKKLFLIEEGVEMSWKRQNQEIVMTSDFYFMLEYIAEQTGWIGKTISDIE